jgi:predicted nucleic acid-binding protein
MGAQRVAAIADAGPLIHLYEIGQLRLLNLFVAVHVPAIVWQEATESGRVLEEALLGVPVVRRHAPALGDWRNGERLSHLHGGEREALRLCEELGIPLLLTDDLAAREAAVGLGVTPVGSVGIVAKSRVAGMIDLAEAERALRELYDTSSLFVSRAIVEGAVRALRGR